MSTPSPGYKSVRVKRGIDDAADGHLSLLGAMRLCRRNEAPMMLLMCAIVRPFSRLGARPGEAQGR